MKKTKKYFKWLTFLSAPLLATTSLFALTSCSSEESSSSSSASSSNGGSNSGNNGGSSNPNKEIPEDKILLSKLVNNKNIEYKYGYQVFLDWDDYKDSDIAWQYTDGTLIEYKAIIHVDDGYSGVSPVKMKDSGEYLRADNIPGFTYNFTISKNLNTNTIEYKNISSQLKKWEGTDSYFLPYEKQAIMIDDYSKRASALSLILDNNFIVISFANEGTYNIINKLFGDKVNNIFSGTNGERYYRFNEDNYKKFFNENTSGSPVFGGFKNLKGSINIEI